MRGVEFEQGCDEQEHHPLVGEIRDVGLRIGEPMEHEEDVCHILHALQSVDNLRIALVELHRLHQGEKHGAQQEHPAGVKQHIRINKAKCKAARTDNHQYAAKQKNSTLYLT